VGGDQSGQLVDVIRERREVPAERSSNTKVPLPARFRWTDCQAPLAWALILLAHLPDLARNAVRHDRIRHAFYDDFEIH